MGNRTSDGLKDPDEVDDKYKQWNVEELPLPYDNGLKVLAGTKGQLKLVRTLSSAVISAKMLTGNTVGIKLLLKNHSAKSERRVKMSCSC